MKSQSSQILFMKYLKRFNEELRPRTYLSAAKKLTAIGHTDRAKELKDWAEETEKREEIAKWKDRLQDYGLFGTYKMNIVNPLPNIYCQGISI